MPISYNGMRGTIQLGTDKLSRCVREELALSPNVTCINLNTCEAYDEDEKGTIHVLRISPLDLIPVLARTPARRRRYGVSYRNEG